MKVRWMTGVAAAAMCWAALASAQDNSSPPPATQPYVTWDQYQKVLQNEQKMQGELDQIQKQHQQDQANAEQDANDTEAAIKSIQDAEQKDRLGQETLVIAGDANFGFQTQNHSDSTFFADVSPLILWQPVDSKFLIETAFDLGIGGSDVDSESSTLTVNLADISYELCDYCTVGAGLFAVPFGQYHNHFDPPWVDKFPDDPLAFDAIAPISEVGAFMRGAIPSGTTKWTYDFYVANGPNLNTVDAGSAGQLNFDDFTDLNNNKAVGGRIGFMPFPDLEAGYSIQYSRPNPDGFPNVYAYLQAADIHYKPTIDQISGQLDVAAEWIWSDVSQATYDPTGSLGFGPLNFDNYSQGGYVSCGYRPTEVENQYLRNFEFLGRYDTLRTPLGAPGGDHETRYTLGLDYWVTSYVVLKGAYEIDHKTLGLDQNAFIFQIGVGL